MGPSMACVASVAESFVGLTGLESGERFAGEEIFVKACSGLLVMSAGLPGALEGPEFWCCRWVGEAGEAAEGRVALMERCVEERERRVACYRRGALLVAVLVEIGRAHV